MDYKRILDHIGIAGIAIMVGIVIGASMAWEAGFVSGKVIRGKESMRNAIKIVEEEYSQSCRPWFTDNKRNEQSEIYMCVRPKFIQPVE